MDDMLLAGAVGRDVPGECSALQALFQVVGTLWLRCPPGSSLGAMHGAAHWAELGQYYPGAQSAL